MNYWYGSKAGTYHSHCDNHEWNTKQVRVYFNKFNAEKNFYTDFYNQFDSFSVLNEHVSKKCFYCSWLENKNTKNTSKFCLKSCSGIMTSNLAYFVMFSTVMASAANWRNMPHGFKCWARQYTSHRCIHGYTLTIALGILHVLTKYFIPNVLVI